MLLQTKFAFFGLFMLVLPALLRYVICAFLCKFLNIQPDMRNSLKIILQLGLHVFCSLVLQAQQSKRTLSVGDFYDWPVANNAAISPNGKFVFYAINSANPSSRYSIFKRVKDGWEIAYKTSGIGFFSKSGEYAILKGMDDSVRILGLNRSGLQYQQIVNIPFVSNFVSDEWDNKIAFISKIKGKVNRISIFNPKKGWDTTVQNVKRYYFGENRAHLFLVLNGSAEQKDAEDSLVLLNLETKACSYLLTGFDLKDLIFYNNDQLIAFLCKGVAGHPSENKICTVTGLKGNNMLTISQQGEGGTEIGDLVRFSKNGKRIFLQIEIPRKKGSGLVSVDVWNYQDKVLQSEQLQELGDSYSYAGIFDINSGQIERLQKSEEQVSIFQRPDFDNFEIFSTSSGSLDERFFSRYARPSVVVRRIDTDEERSFPVDPINLSDDGRFLIGFADNSDDLLSFDLKTGAVTNISNTVPVPKELNEYSLDSSRMLLFYSWDNIHHGRIIVYDKYDIWSVDPAGREMPICMTNGYGRRNNLQLRFPEEGFIMKGEKYILHCTWLGNMKEGFASMNLRVEEDPVILFSGPYRFSAVCPSLDSKNIIKATSADVYLVRRESASLSPNYFLTSDFVNFDAISDNYPEEKVNWLTDSLLHFPSFGRIDNLGILYKPENFDPKKRYPVILRYYEVLSDRLNYYRDPFDIQSFSIPWFVSHGYIVFVPDIHFEVGRNGRSACSTLLSAVEYLDKRVWVDSAHIGIMGHSFGGFVTYYAVANTNRFAAAISSSGVSDYILEYESLWDNGPSKQGYIEGRQGRMKGTLWEKRDEYIENSPVLYADKIQTPLLELANKLDGSVTFSQGLAMFLSLRRLGKPVWMLQYDGQGHGVGGNAMIDFTVRSQQFFDFYLKNGAAPKWMVEGVRANDKGVKTGLEEEPMGIKPGQGIDF